jgi:UDP-GlcNAc:undecaprenyl-phosphate/decaprenyl-phosphate GlcNAc-1-phosphate transferase
MSSIFFNSGLVISSAAISAAITRFCIAYALRRNLLDHPNARSSHEHPVPRVGGVGIFVGFALPFMALAHRDHWLVILLAGSGFAAVGLLDDFRNLAASRKYVLQLVIVAGVLASGVMLRAVTIPVLGMLRLGWLAVPFSLVWLTGFPNFFNFMDGTNGMAGGTGVIYGAFLAAYAYMQGRPELGVVGLLIAGTSLGFLIHNFPRARTFMGDAGSLFLGVTTALLVVLLFGSLVSSLILCSVFIYDCVTTIFRRLRRRENIFRAHRSHHYQRLVSSGWSHPKVAALYFAMHVLAGILGLVYLRSSVGAQIIIILLDLTMLLFLSRLVKVVERKRLGIKAQVNRCDA